MKMSVLNDYECHVARLPLRRYLMDEAVTTLLESAGFISYQHTGAGYFLAAGHPSLPTDRITVVDRAV